MILLPRAYLMNTSYNKGRIIEHGWKNVLKNTLGLSPGMPNRDGCEENRISASQAINRVPKRQLPLIQNERYRIHPQTTSRHVKSGCTSVLKVTNTKKHLDCKMEPQNKRREVIVIPEKLKGSRKVDRASKGLISIETGGIMKGDNVLGCTENEIRKISCSKNGDLSIINLEQEGELLFSCK